MVWGKRSTAIALTGRKGDPRTRLEGALQRLQDINISFRITDSNGVGSDVLNGNIIFSEESQHCARRKCLS